MHDSSIVHPGESLYLIRQARQLRALSSPVRQEIVDALAAAGPASVAEVAEHLGRAPDSLYFHLRQLERVGLVVEVEPRKSGRHIAVVYDVPGRPMRIAQERTAHEPMDAVIGGVLRLARRDYRRGLKDPGAVLEGPGRDLWGGRVKGWVSERDLPRVNALLEELQRVVRQGRPGEGRRGVALAFVLAPVGRKKPARHKQKAASKTLATRGGRPRKGTTS